MITASNTVICILGPTCVGKSRLSINIAQIYPSEIISVDSYMIYKHMNIGTDKPNIQDLKNIQHYFIDILSPLDTYSVHKFCYTAYNIIQSCFQRRILPILVGGNLMYMWVLQKFFIKYNSTVIFNFLNIGLLPKNKKVLLNNITIRLRYMLANGFINETNMLKKKYLITVNDTSMKAIGYKELLLYLENKISLNIALNTIIKSTVQLANKQLLWLKKWRDIFYFNTTEKNNRHKIYQLINNHSNKRMYS